MLRISKRLGSALHAVYLAGFLLNVSYALLLYIQSSYLETFLSGELIGIIYSLGALACIIGLLFLPSALKRHGQLYLTRGFIALVFASIVGLAFSSTVYFAAFFFILYFTFELLLYVALDIYLEHLSSVGETGNIRGHYLTIVSAAVALTPFLVGKLVSVVGFKPIFIVSALFVIPMLFVITRHVPTIPLKKLRVYSPITGLRKAWGNRNVLCIVSTYFLLQFFYSWMVIYTPIYLHTVMQMPWSDIGIVFTIMLLPFVLFQLPLGKVADKRTGEKEILMTGLVIMACATGALTFLNGTSVALWAVALFLTRTGASFVEIMNETYFFKHVRDTDADVISFYRIMSPLAYIVGPLVATVLLFLLPMQYLFLILGCGILLGLYPAYTLEDTL